jgi:hypothetical protein
MNKNNAEIENYKFSKKNFEEILNLFSPNFFNIMESTESEGSGGTLLLEEILFHFTERNKINYLNGQNSLSEQTNILQSLAILLMKIENPSFKEDELLN